MRIFMNGRHIFMSITSLFIIKLHIIRVKLRVTCRPNMLQ